MAGKKTRKTTPRKQQLAQPKTSWPYLTIRETFGDTIGDIPIFSYYALVRMMEEDPIRISGALLVFFKNALKQASDHNRMVFLNRTGKVWACIAPDDFISIHTRVGALFDEVEKETVRKYVGVFHKVDVERRLQIERRELLKIIKGWFYGHFGDFVYKSYARIPDPVIQYLYDCLGAWIFDEKNLFAEDIEEMIIKVARSEDIKDIKDAEDAWKKMGGVLLRYPKYYET